MTKQLILFSRENHIARPASTVTSENPRVSPLFRSDQTTKAIHSVGLISSPASSQRQRLIPYRRPIHSETLGFLMFGSCDKHDYVTSRGGSGFVNAIPLHAEDLLLDDRATVSVNCFNVGNAQC